MTRQTTRRTAQIEAEGFLTLSDIAQRAGITYESARTYHKRATANREAGQPHPGDLPREDIRLGLTPGWRESTIAAWLVGRPRVGSQK